MVVRKGGGMMLASFWTRLLRLVAICLIGAVLWFFLTSSSFSPQIRTEAASFVRAHEGLVLIGAGILLAALLLLPTRNQDLPLSDLTEEASEEITTCGECGQQGTNVRWCQYAKGVATIHTWLCHDCQYQYDAVEE